MKKCWLDIRNTGDLKAALRQEAIHHRFDAIVADDPADLGCVPPTVTRVLMAGGQRLPDGLAGMDVDLVVVDPSVHGEPADLATRHPGIAFGRYVEVVDAASLADACRRAGHETVTVLRFQEPTHIPLEIVLAAAADTTGTIITAARTVAEATVHFGVLQHGPHGVMLVPASVGEAGQLKAAARTTSPDLELTTLEVTDIAHAGMGERACVDTCTYLGPDEGILVGSRSRGLVLCASETHPLPYMPTRPFRVNAGAVMSYTLTDLDRTRYLSELRAGGRVLAVTTSGRTRSVPIGRVKIETRPLLSINAVSSTGRPVNLIVQDDWHVRVLGPQGAVLNSTELVAGDQILGYLPSRDRHVGYPIDELCHEL